MSAEVLRRAARNIRADYPDAGDDPDTFMRAVADWLDATAVRIDKGQRTRQRRGNHSWRGSNEALAVARAYLGGMP